MDNNRFNKLIVFVCRLIAVERDLLKNVLIRLKYCQQEEKVQTFFFFVIKIKLKCYYDEILIFVSKPF